MSSTGKRKLCVAGCSVSDYTKVDRTYGEILAKDIDFDYVHEAVGCGSNDRIWRRITNHIMNGTLTERDIIIIQYTEVTRTEFWSSYSMPPYEHQGPKEEPSYDLGRILSFKMGSHVWQPYHLEKDFFKTYEQYFVNDSYSRETFNVKNFNFQHMLKSLNMTVVFYLSMRIGQHEKDICLDHFKKLAFDDPTHARQEYDLEINDDCHMNQAGHEFNAKNLKEHLAKLNLI